MEKKVLFTASTYSHIVRFHRPYLRAFAELGWTVDAACGGAVMDIPECRRVIHLPLEKSITAPANFRAAALLRKELKAEGYALISTHTSLAAFFTRLAARGLDTTVVNTCHGYLFDNDTPAPKRALLLEAERLTARRTDLLLTMNDTDLDIAQKYRLGKTILPIPGMGVDFAPLDDCPPTAGKLLRSELALPEGAFAVLYPAEFSSRKSQATLLHALALLPEDVFLLLPGNGTLLDECKTLAERLGVESRVRFPGNMERMAPWYAAADCAVSSSRSEGLPFNVMEAMHAALPIAATAVKGHTDLIRDGVNGLLFPYGDAAACAGKLRLLKEDRALAAQLGQQARADSEQYRLEAVLPQVMAAYRSVAPSLEPLPAPAER